jgi:FkbM family methyltransferase
MLLNFTDLVKKYSMNIKGVIHIGAHFGQEFKLYEECNISNIMFFEPVPSTFKTLKDNIGDRAILVNTALGNIVGEVEMFTETSNEGQSSSILEPDFHLIQHPQILFTDRVKVPITKLDSFIEHKDNYNVINVDVQGYELEVFKGGSEFLHHIDYIITEINRADLYKNCARVEELDSFLGRYSFKRVETDWAGQTWGDALYIKY